MAAFADLVAPLMPDTVPGGDWAAKVLRKVAERGHFGATDDELQAMLQAPGGLNNIRPRRNELVNAGLLVTTSLKRPTSTGKTASVHILAPALQATMWPALDQHDCNLAQAASTQPVSPPAGINQLHSKLAMLGQQALRATLDEGVAADGDLRNEAFAACLYPVATGPGQIEVRISLSQEGLALEFRISGVPVDAPAEVAEAARRIRDALVAFQGQTRETLLELEAQGVTFALHDSNGSQKFESNLDVWANALLLDDALTGVLTVVISPEELESFGHGLEVRVREFTLPALRAAQAIAEQSVDPSQTLAAEMNWTQAESEELWDLAQRHRQLLLAGPPGTGKTKAARTLASLIAPPANVRLVQFHPSYGYEDFVEGIRPQLIPSAQPTTPGVQSATSLSFVVRRGVLRSLVDDAQAAPDEDFVVIIDEINRANLPRVLGELLFALEYRDTTVELPYSGDNFSIPSNIWFLGTMNTADRSVAFMDAAMRRRFKEFRLGPNMGVLQRWHAKHTSVAAGAEAVKRLAALNVEVRALLDEDRSIGHSYLLVDPEVVSYETIWREDLEPVLRDHLLGRTEELASLETAFLSLS
jgi:5-methylcytosine-specific restriction protein B